MELRKLLSRHRIEWRDKGPNCSRNFVNIQCPFCKDDPSYHLRINENSFWWYCLRNSNHHGNSLPYLLKQYGVDVSDIPVAATTTHEYVVREVDTKYQENFDEASLSHEVIEYLAIRKFSDPLAIIKKFDLRYAQQGKWAGRLLIPLTTGWTGRSMRKHIEPRYLSETNSKGFATFGKGSSVVLVEGPIDAMKIASVVNDMMVIAMTSSRVSPAIMNELRQLCGTCYYCPDNDMQFRFPTILDIRMNCPLLSVKNVQLPDGVKDPGEMSEIECKEWVYSISV